MDEVILLLHYGGLEIETKVRRYRQTETIFIQILLHISWLIGNNGYDDYMLYDGDNRK